MKSDKITGWSALASGTLWVKHKAAQEWSEYNMTNRQSSAGQVWWWLVFRNLTFSFPLFLPKPGPTQIKALVLVSIWRQHSYQYCNESQIPCNWRIKRRECMGKSVCLMKKSVCLMKLKPLIKYWQWMMFGNCSNFIWLPLPHPNLKKVVVFIHHELHLH